MKETIAQKTVNNARQSGKKRKFPWVLLTLPFGAVGYVCQYLVPGYRFTALVCLAIVLLILFYSGMPLIARFAPKFARRATVIVTVCLVLFALAAGATEYCILREALHKPTEAVDYVVVLGAKVREDGPSVSLWDRIYAARDYLRDNPQVTAVVSGGQGADEHMTEAQAMQQELIQLGIAPERIWMEDRATNTGENLRFSLDVIEARTGTRPRKVAVVSSEYHMLRSRMIAEKCGVEFVGVPARTSRWTQMLNHCMREVPAVWKYAILGGNGND